jgi:hypothetical protein
MTNQTGLDGRHRHKNGEVSKKHGDMLTPRCVRPTGPNSLQDGLVTKN